MINDETVVEKSVPLEELVLHAKGGPFGGARVVLRLSDIPDGCRVEMEEFPVSGPAAILPNRLSDLAAWPRNRETLWRLGALPQRLKPTELSTERLTAVAVRCRFGRVLVAPCRPDTRCASGPCP